MKINSFNRHSTPSAPRPRPAYRALRLAAAAAAVALSGATGAAGCGGDNSSGSGSSGSPIESTQFIERLTSQSIDKIDILLAIDNSRSMADKQAILSLAVPDLVQSLLNPRCVDQNGIPAAMQPAGPLEACPVQGTKREFQPVTDVHIGVITSSLGGHGADTCPNQDDFSCGGGGANLSNNDKGQLIARLDPCSGGDAPTYQQKGFLAWDPKQSKSPPGEGDVNKLITTLRDMVTGAGQIGCGYEAQLESWYRFLIDPEPYATITAINGKATPEGLDTTLLTQRSDFLRPDSLVSIVMLTDENDCSIKEFGQFYFAAQLKNPNGTAFHLPRARSECATNPNDPCCKSCGQDAGNCPADPTCFDANNQVKALTDVEDPPNLRCFDQKRRFGIDFLHPIDRYTTALVSNVVPNRSGSLVPNPLFTDLNPQDSNSSVRDPGRVFLAGIVGVPWQDIARNKDDLSQGFKSADELLDQDANGLTTWDIILGDPPTLVPPADPHMIETIFPRAGINPITGDAIKPPGDASNPINGSEWTVKDNDDLQYACIFPLPTPRDCSDPSIVACDCQDPTNDSPLCEPDPVDPTKRTYQTKAKAYPAVRELQVLRSLGPQAITASVCPAQLNAMNSPDFGYRPAVEAIVSALRSPLQGQCLHRSLKPDNKGQVSCVLLEARRVDESLIADCNACLDLGRQPVPVDHLGLVKAAQQDPIAQTSQWNCFCEITQTTGDNLDACQNKVEDPPLNGSGEEVHGWCYVDATTTPFTGNPELVASCPATSKRILRLTGGGTIKPDATAFIACAEP